MAVPNTNFKTSINLSPMLIKQLDKLCRHFGENQSQTIRRLIIESYTHHADKYNWTDLPHDTQS